MPVSDETTLCGKLGKTAFLQSTIALVSHRSSPRSNPSVALEWALVSASGARSCQRRGATAARGARRDAGVALEGPAKGRL